MPTRLDNLRQEIDAIDRTILEKLNARAKLAAEIGHIKKGTNAPFYVPAREESLMRRLSEANTGPLPDFAIRHIFREIISASIALEKKLKIAYLGPQATYTQQAAMKNFGSSVHYEPIGTIQDVFEIVERKEADYGVIPIENSNEGGVFHSLDMLAESDLHIVAEIYLPIEHCLISSSPLDTIDKVYSKDQALGQCRSWLRRHLPKAQLIPSASTSHDIDSAKDVPGVAVIASALAAEIYSVPILQSGIQDKADNTTRFFAIGHGQASVPSGANKDKTSLLITINDEPAALQAALEPFGKRGINMSKIESRPSRRKAWDYVFFIDIIGHWHDPAVQEAITELKTRCPFIKWLGSYPNSKK